ncbi:hypothetical protein OM33_01820 [Pseudoalteromonas piratica]|uniref:Uncharacterized protein n=2 Tax=Pseudoalteromonas piratica TaxID=1348114 RepID=A0A0A7EBY0_9GAMM|nr:hypothetical protein OM33_01820 [Pseudoalteromonas piratica]
MPVDAKPYDNYQANDQVVQFAPGVISTTQFEINSVFNEAGDKVIFSRCSNDFKHCTMMQSSYQNNQWQASTILPFSGQFLDADAYFNADFSYLYFVSKRPIDNSEQEASSINLWRVSHHKNTWGTPEYLNHLSSSEHDLYPSITANGDLYFPSFRNEQRLLYVAKAIGKSFEKPVALPSEMFGEKGLIGDTVVLPNGKTIIFSMRRADSLGEGDLYVSHKINGKWTIAKHLGDKVNSKDHEFTPIVSPDGQYLFFTRIEKGVGNLYQISLSALPM